MENKRITSLANPEIKFVSSLKRNSNRKKASKSIVEGYRENKLLLESGRAVDSIYICKELFNGIAHEELILLFKKRKIRMVEVSEKPFVHMSYRDNPDGFISVFPIYKQNLNDLNSENNNKILIADQIEKPGNLGAMLRTAKAFGFNTVIVCDERTNIFNPNVIRSSVGHLFTINVVSASSKDVIKYLNANDIEILILDSQSNISIRSFSSSKKFALVVGSEHDGISKNWFDTKATTLKIDSSTDVDSINAATAAAIAMWELSN